MKCNLFFFQTSRKILTKFEKILQLWALTILCINACVTTIAFYFADHIFHSNDAVGKFNDLLKYLCLISCFYVTLIESFMKKKYMQYLYKQLSWIKYQFKNSFNTDLKMILLKYHRKFMIKFLGIMFIYFCSLIYNLFIHKFPKQRMIYYTYVYDIPFFICRCRHLQLMYYINYIHTFCKVLNEKIHEIVIESKKRKKLLVSSDKESEKYLCDQLQYLKAIYGEIWLMTRNINEYFGWSETFNFAQNFVQITCDLYWINMIMSMQIISSEGGENFYGKIMLCKMYSRPLLINLITHLLQIVLVFNQIVTVLTISYVLNAASNCYTEALLTPILIHQVERRSDDLDLNDMVSINHF